MFNINEKLFVIAVNPFENNLAELLQIKKSQTEVSMSQFFITQGWKIKIKGGIS